MFLEPYYYSSDMIEAIWSKFDDLHLFFSLEIWQLCPVVKFHAKKNISLQGLFGACILTIGLSFTLYLNTQGFA
jgi:hypothetical protein